MTGRDLGVVGIAAIAIIAAIAGVSLLTSNWPTSSSAGSRGDLISIPTAPAVVPAENGGIECLSAAFSGMLVSHPRWGIAVSSGRGAARLMFWPHGYAGRIAGHRLELLDERGAVVGRTGDRISGGGGETTINGVVGWTVCPVGIEVQPAR